MRRLYVLMDEEFFEDFEEIDLDPESDSIDPPMCPLCRRELLAAYQEDGELCVLYEDSLERGAARLAEAWYLVCGSFECPYEEQVERVFRPAGALLYDSRAAMWDFGEATGFFHSEPRFLRSLLDRLQELGTCGHRKRKLTAHIAELQYQYGNALKERRDWLARMPVGQQVMITTAESRIEGNLLGEQQDGKVAILAGGQDLVWVSVDCIQIFAPYDVDVPPSTPIPPGYPGFNHQVVVINNERVVVRGHHFWLDEVDRFGRYHVTTQNPAAAAELHMKQVDESCYSGVLLPREAEERYRVRHLVKVRGYWVEAIGTTANGHALAIRSYDPAAAAALALHPRWVPWSAPEAGHPDVPAWSGFVTGDQVEAEEKHCLHVWPIPEVTRGHVDK